MYLSKILRLKDVMERTGLSRATIYKLIKENSFPAQINITERCVGWSEDDIHDWVLQKLEKSDIVKRHQKA